MLTTILPQIIIAATATVTITSTLLYITTAKRNIPITQKEANILWKLHKQKTNCNYNEMYRLIKSRGEITGFKCQCGYRYTQKSPLLGCKPNSKTVTQSCASKSLHH